MAMTKDSKYLNSNRLEIEGMFNLSASAAVNNIVNPDGSIKTVTGEFMSCVKTGTGTYQVTVKSASSESGAVFQPVEILNADADLMATTLAVALSARVSAVGLDANGNILITIITAQTTGAAADTTAAVSVTFDVVICTQRMAAPL
jgi:hypothetical protein